MRYSMWINMSSQSAKHLCDFENRWFFLPSICPSLQSSQVRLSRQEQSMFGLEASSTANLFQQVCKSFELLTTLTVKKQLLHRNLANSQCVDRRWLLWVTGILLRGHPVHGITKSISVKNNYSPWFEKRHLCVLEKIEIPLITAFPCLAIFFTSSVLFTLTLDFVRL